MLKVYLPDCFRFVYLCFFSPLALPNVSKKRRRRGLLSLQSPERDEEDDVQDGENKDYEEEDEADDFQLSEGSENEMETEMLDYI